MTPSIHSKFYQNSLQLYRQEFTKAIEAEYPLSDSVKQELKTFQQQLGLKIPDIDNIERELIALALLLFLASDSELFFLNLEFGVRSSEFGGASSVPCPYRSYDFVSVLNNPKYRLM